MPVVIPHVPDFVPVDPSGNPSPPLIHLAGVHHGGKSLHCADAARAVLPNGDRLFPSSFWVSLGEGEADHYGTKGDYQIVPHDGSYANMAAALLWVERQPDINGIPPLIIFDGFTELTALLNSEQAELSYSRALKKAMERNWPLPDPIDTKIGFDQNNPIKERFIFIVEFLRNYRGVVIGTSNLEEAQDTDDSGKPLPGTRLRQTAHKSLPKRVDFAIELRTQHASDAYVTAVRDPSRTMLPGGAVRKVNDFSVLKFMSEFGLLDARRPRQRLHLGAPRPEAYLSEVAAQINPRSAPEDEYRARPVRLSPDLVMSTIQSAWQVAPEQARDLITSFQAKHAADALQGMTVRLKTGPASAFDALNRALELIEERAAQPAEPTTPTEPVEPTEARPAAEPQAEPAVPAPVVPAQPAGPQTTPEIQGLIDEVYTQAEVLGLQPANHLKPILKELGMQSVGQVTTTERRTFGGWVMSKRRTVITALNAKGLADVARDYAALGEQPAPAELLARMTGAVTVPA